MNKVVTGNTPLFCDRPILYSTFVLTLAFDRTVLYGNVTPSMVVLSTQKSVFKKKQHKNAFNFTENLFQN